MASAPISQCQQIDLAMLILVKSKRFQVDIRTWNTRPPAEHTWDNFKEDTFRIAYNSLRALGDLTLDQSPVLNQAQLMESIMHAMQLAAAQSDNSAFDAADTPPYPPVQQQQQQQHAGNSFESTLLKKFEELTAEFLALKKDVGQRNLRSSHGRTPKRYCWSCGCYPHWGQDCKVKKTGHKDSANFKDRKGGSNKDCRPNE